MGAPPAGTCTAPATTPQVRISPSRATIRGPLRRTPMRSLAGSTWKLPEKNSACASSVKRSACGPVMARICPVS